MLCTAFSAQVILVHKETFFSPTHAHMGSTVTGLMDACACVLVCRVTRWDDDFHLSSRPLSLALSLFLRTHVDRDTHQFAHARTYLPCRLRSIFIRPPFPSPCPSLFPPLLSLSLCGEQKEETLLLDVFSLQQVQFTQKRTRCLVFSVISTLTFIFPSAPTSTSSFFFYTEATFRESSRWKLTDNRFGFNPSDLEMSSTTRVEVCSASFLWPQGCQRCGW